MPETPHETSPETLAEQARRIHFSSIVIDTHVDTVVRWLDLDEDLGTKTGRGYNDLPLMRAGNLTAAFYACCVGYKCVAEGTAIRRALDMIDGVKEMCRRYPDVIEVARTAADVRRCAAQGKLAAVIAIEGGHAIADDLRVLRQYFELGVRYMSLTHFNTHSWADSATDAAAHNGLSDFGRDVVREMNTLGMIVDVSHASDAVFDQVVALSSRPVMASHSSARALVDHPRNMTDGMYRAIAATGGVACVTAWPEYLTRAYWQGLEDRADELAGRTGDGANRRRSASGTSSAISDLMALTGGDRWKAYNVLVDAAIPFPTLADLLDHIDHAVGAAGIDHVGIGTDHGAVRFEIGGIEDCSKLPALTEGLLGRGYGEADVRKLLGENVLRVMEAVIGE